MLRRLLDTRQIEELRTDLAKAQAAARAAQRELLQLRQEQGIAVRECEGAEMLSADNVPPTLSVGVTALIEAAQRAGAREEDATKMELVELRARVARLRDAERERDALRSQLDEVREHNHAAGHARLAAC